MRTFSFPNQIQVNSHTIAQNTTNSVWGTNKDLQSLDQQASQWWRTQEQIPVPPSPLLNFLPARPHHPHSFPLKTGLNSAPSSHHPSGGVSLPPAQISPRLLPTPHPYRYLLGDSTGLSEVSRGWSRCPGNEWPCLLARGVARVATLDRDYIGL
uniref:Uncharacterized protein n=1 Tax=Pipistrellus kuhlii TaxID=59472 RepID=A0A7J7WLG0_PIPKU|nr:hypothetical protein mPipKuh1_007938 [Pipistrellus kuhlii]